MQVFLNKQAVSLTSSISLAELLDQGTFKPPFAVAINADFIPKNSYSTTFVTDGDRIEVISPVTGG
jgi:sulfur carrier protein